MAIREKNGVYFLDYRVNGRRIREKVGSNKKLAESIWHKRQTEIVENKFLDVRKDEKITFRDFSKMYLENHAKVNKRSWETTDVHYLKRLNANFGDKLLFQMTSMEIEKYKAQRIKDGVSPAYVNRELACLKCLFNKAIQWGKLHRLNPMKNVKLFKENNQRTRYLEKKEMFRLLDECGNELKSIVMVAANTGMRRGEIMSLTWEDIDLSGELIYIRKSKSGDSRIIPMNRAVKEVFQSLTLRKKKNAEVFSKRYREGFEAAVKRAKIENFRFHDLRHHFASYSVMAGMDLNTLRELLGHKTLSMTLRYSHLSPNHKAKAIQLMDSFWTSQDLNEILRNSVMEK